MDPLIQQRECAEGRHDWGDWVETRAPTIEEGGEERRTCRRDGCNAFEPRPVPRIPTFELPFRSSIVNLVEQIDGVAEGYVTITTYSADSNIDVTDGDRALPEALITLALNFRWTTEVANSTVEDALRIYFVEAGFANSANSFTAFGQDVADPRIPLPTRLQITTLLNNIAAIPNNSTITVEPYTVDGANVIDSSIAYPDALIALTVSYFFEGNDPSAEVNTTVIGLFAGFNNVTVSPNGTEVFALPPIGSIVTDIEGILGVQAGSVIDVVITGAGDIAPNGFALAGDTISVSFSFRHTEAAPTQAALDDAVRSAFPVGIRNNVTANGSGTRVFRLPALPEVVNAIRNMQPPIAGLDSESVVVFSYTVEPDFDGFAPAGAVINLVVHFDFAGGHEAANNIHNAAATAAIVLLFADFTNTAGISAVGNNTDSEKLPLPTSTQIVNTVRTVVNVPGAVITVDTFTAGGADVNNDGSNDAHYEAAIAVTVSYQHTGTDPWAAIEAAIRALFHSEFETINITAGDITQLLALPQGSTIIPVVMALAGVEDVDSIDVVNANTATTAPAGYALTSDNIRVTTTGLVHYVSPRPDDAIRDAVRGAAAFTGFNAYIYVVHVNYRLLSFPVPAAAEIRQAIINANITGLVYDADNDELGMTVAVSIGAETDPDIALLNDEITVTVTFNFSSDAAPDLTTLVRSLFNDRIRNNVTVTADARRIYELPQVSVVVGALEDSFHINIEGDVVITGNDIIGGNWALPADNLVVEIPTILSLGAAAPTQDDISGWLRGATSPFHAGIRGNVSATVANFETSDFALPLTSVSYIFPFLNSAQVTGEGTAASPAELPLEIQLTDAAWRAILTEIERANRFVNLDLRTSTSGGGTTGGLRSDGTFDPLADFVTGKNRIVELVLPDAATSIVAAGDDWTVPPFGFFEALTTVEGRNITTIGDAAFRNVSSLENVNFPILTTISVLAFSDTNLESASFPQLASIGVWAFNNATSLESVSFPASAAIAGNPFAGSTSLASFNVTGAGPLSVIEGGRALVRGGTELIAYPAASGSITLNTITTIGSAAFNDASGLVSVNFPNVTTIGHAAFHSTRNLTSVNFPLAETIGESAFAFTNLASVDFPMVTTIGGQAFSVVPSLVSVDFPLVTSIGCSVFYSATSLTTVTIPSVTELGSGVFGFTGDTPLTITMGMAAPTVGQHTFYGVGAKPVTVRIPQGATGFGESPTDIAANNWGNAFRGRGWDGANFMGGTVNTNINLTIDREGDDTGEAGINVRFEIDAGGNMFASDTGFTISRSGANQSFNATVAAGFDNVEWSINGLPVAGSFVSDGGRTVTIDAANHTIREHRLDVLARRVSDNRWFSAHIDFTVED